MNYIVLLGADQFLRERAVVAALRIFNGGIVGVSKNGPLNRNRYFDDILFADPMDPNKTLQAVIDYNEKTGKIIKGVIPLNDWTLQSGSAVASHFKLPYLSKSTIEKSRNKDLMKLAFTDNNLPTPKHRVFKNFIELEQHVEELGFPIVIKPRDFGGSGGVILIRDKVELKSAFDHCQFILNEYAESFRIEKNVYQVEQYIHSEREVSVEILNSKHNRLVLAVTEKYLGPEPYFAEIGHCVPSKDNENIALHKIAMDACNALGIDRGLAHVEIRIQEGDRYYLMEVGARPAGDAILDQVEKVYGVNPYQFHIESYLTEVPDLPKKMSPKGVSTICFLKAKKGIINDVKIPTNLTSEVASLYVTAKKGDFSEDPMCWRSREGTVELFYKDVLNTKNKDTDLSFSKNLAEAIFTVSS